MRRSQKEKWKKALVLICGTGVLVFGLHALSGLVQSVWQQLRPEGLQLQSRIGEGLLLNDRALFSYLRFHEEGRGPFRWISERILCHNRYLIAAAEPDTVSENLWVKEETEGAEEKETEKEDEVTMQEEQLSVWVADGLLESVMSENASYGGYLPISYAKGAVEAVTVIQQPEDAASVQESGTGVKLLLENNYCMQDLANPDYLLSTYYIVDSITSALPELFDGEALLGKDLSIQPAEEGYQILIYHTHASEGFIDSREGEVMDTVRGPGEQLAEYLRGYGYTVYHDMTAYDRKDGKDNRNYAYSTAAPQIEAFLDEHPEVQVIIDLHRDSGAKRVTKVNGKQTAQIMLFNGLCRNASGPIDYLENPNLSGNLAFSLQTNLVGRVLYPNLMFRIYLKNYRYNQHFRERCMLIELGTDQNTVKEAYNAMEPLADILDTVLRGQ